MCRLAILTLATQFLSPGPLAPFDSALVLILHAPRLAITINCETVRVVIRREFCFFLFLSWRLVSMRCISCVGPYPCIKLWRRWRRKRNFCAHHQPTPFHLRPLYRAIFCSNFQIRIYFFKEFKWYLKRTKRNSIIIEFFQGVTQGNVSPLSFSGAHIP